MPAFNWDYFRSLQNGPQEAAASREAEVLANQRAIEATTPGVWQTIMGPHQGSGPEQAIAEYQARVSQPRSDVWGETLSEDRPENLYQELLAPFHLGLKTGMNAFKPVAKKPEQFVKSGSTVLRRDPVTGQLSVAFQGYQKPEKPAKDEGLASQRRLMEDRIKAKRRAIIKETDRKIWGPMIDDVLRDEQTLKELDSGATSSAPQPETPFDGVMRRLPTGFIGTPEGEFPSGRSFGTSNRFQGNPVLAPSGTPVLSVGTVRKGYRFNGGNPSQKESWEKVQ